MFVLTHQLSDSRFIPEYSQALSVNLERLGGSRMWWTYVLAFGAVMNAVGIGIGAFGAHALKDKLTPPDLAIFETAVKYWMYHAIGVCLLALVMTRIENGFIKSSAATMICGALIFSGTLIALVLTGNRMLGAVTPIGGVLLILSWILLAVGVIAHG